MVIFLSAVVRAPLLLPHVACAKRDAPRAAHVTVFSAPQPQHFSFCGGMCSHWGTLASCEILGTGLLHTAAAVTTNDCC